MDDRILRRVFHLITRAASSEWWQQAVMKKSDANHSVNSIPALIIAVIVNYVNNSQKICELFTPFPMTDYLEYRTLNRPQLRWPHQSSQIQEPPRNGLHAIDIKVQAQ